MNYQARIVGFLGFLLIVMTETATAGGVTRSRGAEGSSGPGSGRRTNCPGIKARTADSISTAAGAPPTAPAEAAATLATAKAEATQRKAETTRIAFGAGTALAMLAALSGVRCLESMVAKPYTLRPMFKAVDILLTAGLLGGGAEGFHRIMEVSRRS